MEYIDYDDACPDGHSLAEANAAHKALVDRIANLTGPQVIGDLRCMGPNLVERIEPHISKTDGLALRVFIGLVQRLDGDEGPHDAFMPPVEGAIPGASCTCHDTDEPGVGQLINNVIDAMQDHAQLHRQAGPVSQNGFYL